MRSSSSASRPRSPAVSTLVRGRSVRFQQVDDEAYKATMMRYGMSDAWAQELVDMGSAQNNGIYDPEPRARG
ncbi:hypothetical protein ABZZ47_31910 [Streptomyces sp. NPDC006465]|uniref:hypothetical protein n=1 Tax=Streptomyces sp. NPDC006465 TaxID=3157174 RepID=UPI0033A163AD